MFLLSTGARIDEALRLDRDDWQPARMRVIGKGDRERTVTVTEKARQAIEDYLQARTDPSPALFIGFQPARKNSVGNRLTVQGANHICDQLALRLGIPGFHPHRLRHILSALFPCRDGRHRRQADLGPVLFDYLFLAAACRGTT